MKNIAVLFLFFVSCVKASGNSSYCYSNVMKKVDDVTVATFNEQWLKMGRKLPKECNYPFYVFAKDQNPGEPCLGTGMKMCDPNRVVQTIHPCAWGCSHICQEDNSVVGSFMVHTKLLTAHEYAHYL